MSNSIFFHAIFQTFKFFNKNRYPILFLARFYSVRLKQTLVAYLISFLVEIKSAKRLLESNNSLKQKIIRNSLITRNRKVKNLTNLKPLSSRQTVGQTYMKIGKVPPSKQKTDQKIFIKTQIFG